MPAIPVATVRKMTGAITIFTSRMNASPSGLHAAPIAGAKCPSSAPSRIAISTCT